MTAAGLPHIGPPSAATLRGDAMARTSGRYVLETIKTGDPREAGFVSAECLQALHRIDVAWMEMGCPKGEFLIEFAEREDDG